MVVLDAKLGKVTHHQVQPNETIYSIARKYGLTPADIKKVNPGIKGQLETCSNSLQIPILDSLVRYGQPWRDESASFTPLYYKVQAGDNAFRIARVYFDFSIELLRKRNPSIDGSLKPGQVLHIGWFRHPVQPLEVLIGSLDQQTLPQSDEKSIIEITNPLSGSPVYAKVIGRIPPHLYPAEVDMVMSRETAGALHALDQKFFVRCRYLVERHSASR